MSHRVVIAFFALAAVGLLGAWAVIESGALELTQDELEAAFRTDASAFADIDGVRVHYVDEGSGPAVALLHASFLNLRAWDSMAAALASEFRVIRMDFLMSGLTGPEPNDAYSMQRNTDLFDGLMRKLDVQRFAIVGTSSGGIVAFRYAAQYPDRVSRLILINSAGMPRTAASDPNRPRGTVLSRWLQARHKSRAYWRNALDRNFVEPHEPPEWLIELAWANGRRAGLRREGTLFMRNFRTGDPEAVLARVRAPTLVLWGLDNPTVMHLEADVFQHWLSNAPTLKKKYPGTGHYAYVEEPELIANDVRAFLRGELDTQLVVTTRLPFNDSESLRTP